MKKLKGIQRLPKTAIYDEMNTPVGQLTIVATEDKLHAILWESYSQNPACKDFLNTIQKSKNQPIVLAVKKQLDEYFQGKRKSFDIPLALNGTDFQVKAWKQLQKIPYAKTISYGKQAELLGDKNKARAVGLANGLNPISIIVPCHRVIGSNGKLVGFGGGLDKKSFLLALEQSKSLPQSAQQEGIS